MQLFKTILPGLSLTLLSMQAHGMSSVPLAVGDSIPGGTLYTDSGEAYDLRENLSGQRTVLIFYRGGWCPYCTRHLAALIDVEQDLVEAGFQLLAISPDRPEVLRNKESITDVSYTLLSDSAMAVTRKFGIAFQMPAKQVEKYRSSYNIDIEADSGQTHHLLPHPSVFIVDGEGVIRFAHVNENYRKRLEPEKILAAAKGVTD